MHKYDVEYTDTFGGVANYCWVKRASITAPEWTAFKDWDGNGRREPKAYQRAVMRRAKAAMGLSGVRGVTVSLGDGYEFRPYGMATVLFVTYSEV
jgi:hypothetical protein